MPSRKPLKGGAPRLLGNHGGTEGRAFRRAYDTLVADLGPFPSCLDRFEAARTAVAMINLQAATRALVAARRARDHGRGRRPSAQAIERLSRRQALQDQSYSQALGQLRALMQANGHTNGLAAALRESPS